MPKEMLSYGRKVLGRIRWSARDVEVFLGEYLSEPKAHVVFRPGSGARPLARSRVRLDPKTRLLYRGARFYINGESLQLDGRNAGLLRELADRRVAHGARLAHAPLAGLILSWQRLGYLHLEKTE
jgi:50S ribosomal protein L16 3-hydroxylase